jgi:uncharacterized membrane protein YgcG
VKLKLTNSKATLLSVSLLLFSVLLMHQSCTKVDTRSGSKLALTDAEITQKFFALPANAPEAVRRTAEKMKQVNVTSEFVKSFVKNNGYPVWDKALIQSKRRVASASSRGSSASAEDADTIVIIPVVQVDIAFVDGFITATLNDSVNLDLYRSGDYSAYSFNNVPTDSISADKAAMQIMYFNYRVFGYTRFEVSDNRLLSNDAVLDTSKPHRVFEISSVQEPPQTLTGNESNLLLAVAMCIDIYQSVPCIGIFIDQRIGCSVYIGQSCYTIYVDTGGGGGGSGGGSTGGGGDPGGGGGTPGTFPCANSQGRGIAIANPCGPANPPPVNPIPPLKPPCETVTDFFQIPNVGSGYQTVAGYASGNTEMAYAFNNTGNGVLSTGIPNQHEVGINLVANCIGYVHCHNPGCDYHLFSYEDMEQLYRNVAFGRVTEGTVIGLIASDGTPYMLTIQNKTAFLNAMSTFISDEPDEYERDRKYFQYFEGLDNAAQKEYAFLKFMGDINAGVGLVKGNSFLNDFTELKLSSDGTDVIEIPCNPS